MKKLNINDVGTIWTLMLMAAFLLFAAFTLGWTYILMVVAFISIVLGIPYVFTNLWNKFIAKDE
jgi:hypothetical protein